jgi:hypothetical protein
MGKNKTVKLHKYNSRRERKTTTTLFQFFLQKQMSNTSVTRCRSIYPSHSLTKHDGNYTRTLLIILKQAYTSTHAQRT